MMVREAGRAMAATAAAAAMRRAHMAAMPRALALPVFLSAKEGKHVTNRHVTMGRARTVSIDFTDGAYPAQADGEALELRRAEIDLLPRALTVLAPAR